MSSVKLDLLIAEFPEERGALTRFFEYLANSSGRHIELTVGRIYDLITPSSLTVLAAILFRLEQEALITKVVRVESDGMGGIGDFNSIIDVPETIYDSRLGKNIDVRFDQINLIYKPAINSLN